MNSFKKHLPFLLQRTHLPKGGKSLAAPFTLKTSSYILTLDEIALYFCYLGGVLVTVMNKIYQTIYEFQ